MKFIQFWGLWLIIVFVFLYLMLNVQLSNMVHT